MADIETPTHRSKWTWTSEFDLTNPYTGETFTLSAEQAEAYVAAQASRALDLATVALDRLGEPARKARPEFGTQDDDDDATLLDRWASEG